MAKMGHPHTPTKILELRGSWRAKKRCDPDIDQGMPETPAYLDEQERQIWDKLTQRLQTNNLLTVLDGEILGRYCVLFAAWRKALDFVRQYGETYPVKNDAGVVVSIQVFPQAHRLIKLHRELSLVESNFGMTPSARAALGLQLASFEAVEKKPPAQSTRGRKPKPKAVLSVS